MIYTVQVKPGSKKGPLVEDTSARGKDAPGENGSSVDALHSNAPAKDALAKSRASLSAEAPTLTVYLHAKAVDGAANKQLIEVLAKHFGLRKSALKILRGEKSRIKHVEVTV